MSKSRKRKEPNYGVLREEMGMLSDATPEQQHKIIKGMTVERLACLDAEFEHWAHKNQLPPNGEGWTTWLMMAGRGFGKTRAGADWIYRLGKNRPGSRIALAGATIAEARAIMVERVSGLLSVARWHGVNLRWDPSLNRLTWPNGSQAQLFSGDNADGLRGPEHHFAWGSSNPGLRRGRRRGGAAAQRSADKSRHRRLLYRRALADGRMGRMGRCDCWIFGWRLAADRPCAGDARLCARDRSMGLLSCAGVGPGCRSRIEARHRRSAGRRRASRLHCIADGGIDHRYRGPRVDWSNPRRAARSRLDCGLTQDGFGSAAVRLRLFGNSRGHTRACTPLCALIMCRCALNLKRT